MGLREWLYKLARMYWRIRRPVTMGSRAIIVKDGTVLLVRLSYLEGWYLPGGGVKKGESFQAAVVREIAEECGIKVTTLKLLHLFLSQIEGKVDYIALFEAVDFEQIPHRKPDAEIMEMGFFSIGDLPEGTSPATRRRIEEYKEGLFSAEQW